jgi:hypothetical protein
MNQPFFTDVGTMPGVSHVVGSVKSSWVVVSSRFVCVADVARSSR